ncbi:hypothetical protein DLREEDagrD3_09080 [Denitratisoma sp. agr-D3]
MIPTAPIIGSTKVLEALGYWPSFHDAEVIAFSAERALPFRHGKTLARLTVHVRHCVPDDEMDAVAVPDIPPAAVIRFLFNGICDLDLTQFNHLNVIDCIAVFASEAGAEAELQVAIDPIWGFGGTLCCASVEIEGIEVLPPAC